MHANSIGGRVKNIVIILAASTTRAGPAVAELRMRITRLLNLAHAITYRMSQVAYLFDAKLDFFFVMPGKGEIGGVIADVLVIRRARRAIETSVAGRRGRLVYKQRTKEPGRQGGSEGTDGGFIARDAGKQAG
jgi:hypothetical protein